MNKLLFWGIFCIVSCVCIASDDFCQICYSEWNEKVVRDAPCVRCGISWCKKCSRRMKYCEVELPPVLLFDEYGGEADLFIENSTVLSNCPFCRTPIRCNVCEKRLGGCGMVFWKSDEFGGSASCFNCFWKFIRSSKKFGRRCRACNCKIDFKKKSWGCCTSEKCSFIWCEDCYKKKSGVGFCFLGGIDDTLASCCAACDCFGGNLLPM
ncbi:hypothetical protein ACFLY6_02390 [Candidatus Dependentiae bacterium]